MNLIGEKKKKTGSEDQGRESLGPHTGNFWCPFCAAPPHSCMWQGTFYGTSLIECKIFTSDLISICVSDHMASWYQGPLIHVHTQIFSSSPWPFLPPFIVLNSQGWTLKGGDISQQLSSHRGGSSLHSFFQENNCSAFLFQESREVSSQCRLAGGSRERLGAEASAGPLSDAELWSLGNQYWSRAIVDMIRLGWDGHFYGHPPPCITKKWFHLQGNPFSCKCPQPLSSAKAEYMSWVLEIVDLSEWEAEAWTHRCLAIPGQPPSSPKHGTQHCIWSIARYVSQHPPSATDEIAQ